MLAIVDQCKIFQFLLIERIDKGTNWAIALTFDPALAPVEGNIGDDMDIS